MDGTSSTHGRNACKIFLVKRESKTRLDGTDLGYSIIILKWIKLTEVDYLEHGNGYSGRIKAEIFLEKLSD
jgi:hypothetical protein